MTLAGAIILLQLNLPLVQIPYPQKRLRPITRFSSNVRTSKPWANRMRKFQPLCDSFRQKTNRNSEIEPRNARRQGKTKVKMQEENAIHGMKLSTYYHSVTSENMCRTMGSPEGCRRIRNRSVGNVSHSLNESSQLRERH